MINDDDDNDDDATTTNCTVRGSFAQSCLLPSRADARWMRSLFQFLDARPRTAVYSLAFAISFIPTHGIDTSVTDRAAFDASRELFDLLQDNLRDVDALEFADLKRSRAFDAEDFAKANDSYAALFDARVTPLLRRYGSLLQRRRRLRPPPPSSSSPDNDAIEAFARNFSEEIANGRATLKQIELDVAEMRNLLSRLNGENNEEMRLPANANCTASVREIDLRPLNELMNRLRGVEDDSTIGAKLRDVSTIMTSPIVVVVESNESATTHHPIDEIYTYLEAYAAYAPCVYRYDSLNDMMNLWRERATIAGDDRDDDLRRVMMPVRSVWQSGSSQILWITLHVLAALTVERDNIFVQRMLVILENLSFFIWCGECAVHWVKNYGDAYFRHIAGMSPETLRRIPLDIVLLRCHNTVHFNIASNRGLPIWNLANLCLDYRDFAKRFLLRRGAIANARTHRVEFCRYLFPQDNDDDAAAAKACDQRYLSSLLTLSEAAANTRDEIRTVALKEYFGQLILKRFWWDVNPTTPVSFMW